MAETLGSLCDKLTIVQLKLYHSPESSEKRSSLLEQCEQLKEEIDSYFDDAYRGNIPIDRLTFKSNKIYNESKFKLKESLGSFAEVFLDLARVNCELWHEQEKVFNFESLREQEKSHVMQRLATLNLERNAHIDALNHLFSVKIQEHFK